MVVRRESLSNKHTIVDCQVDLFYLSERKAFRSVQWSVDQTYFGELGAAIAT